MPVLLPQTILLLLITLFVAIATMIYHTRVQRGGLPFRRPLPALDVLRAALGRGAETGRPIHVSPGAGTIGSGTGNRATTAETVAGLLAAERVVNEAALNGAPILASSGDAVAHLALRGALRQVYQRAGQTQDYDPARVQLLAHQNEIAYAVGVTSIYARQRLEASQLIGSFGQEFLLLGEDGAERGIPQVAGTTTTTALPTMILSADATLIGEEMFAAEAYLASSAPAQARLLAHDLIRTTVIVLILAGLVYSLIQPALGLPPLPGL
jgi:hypothetical protein